MAEFSVNPTRFDPYKNFKFRLKWDGRYIAGISHVSALGRATEVVEHREGGDPSTSRKSPGPSLRKSASETSLPSPRRDAARPFGPLPEIGVLRHAALGSDGLVLRAARSHDASRSRPSFTRRESARLATFRGCRRQARRRLVRRDGQQRVDRDRRARAGPPRCRSPGSRSSLS